MEDQTNRKIKEYQKKHRRRSAWKKLLAALGCVVVFCTTYALILPAITKENTAYCGAEEHTHSIEGSCYEKQLACGMEESENHVHSEACYEQVLACNKEEHQHSPACFSNPDADVETAEDWEKDFENIELTGCYADDLLTIAKTQIGYKESEKNYQIMDDGETIKGYTRYGAWYGAPYEDWCAMFVSFCLHYAEVPAEEFPQSAGCGNWIEVLEEKELYLATAEYRSEECGGPYAGDLVFFDWPDEEGNYDGTSDHVGIVSELLYDENDSETLIGFKTIEGNSGNKVTDKNEYFFLDENGEENKELLGFGLMPREDTVLKAEGEDYTITVRYTEEAQLPEDTRLEVREILPGTEEYESYASQAAAAMNEEEGETTRRFFDITLMSGDNEVEPAVPVNVTISLAEAQPTGEDTVVHFPKDGEVELIPADADADGVHYEQGSFSAVGVTNTSGTDVSYTVGERKDSTIYAYVGVGGTITVNVGDYIDGSSGSFQYTKSTLYQKSLTDSGDTYISASFDANARTLTIVGLTETDSTQTVVLKYSVSNQYNATQYTITVNTKVMREGELASAYTSNRYKHLDVNVDANFKIYYYASDGTVTMINPTDIKVTSLSARVYHTRSTGTTELATDEAGDSIDEQWASMKELIGTQDPATHTTNDNPSSIITGSNNYSAVSDYNESDTYNNKTPVASYGVFFEPVASADGGTGKSQHMSVGRVSNSKHKNRLPLAIYDGDTVQLTATVSYVYNGKTYYNDYEVIYVVSNDYNTCVNAYSSEQRGFDVTVDVEDVIEVEATYVEKVDQYGDPVQDATMAVYATDKDYFYYLDDGSENPVDLSALTEGKDYTIDSETGVINLTGGGTITPKYVSTTDENGQFSFKYKTGDVDENGFSLEGVSMSMAGLYGKIGSDYFTIREIDIPNGYRTVSDEIKMKFEYAGTSTEGDSLLSLVMVSTEPYVSGVWAGANANVMATETLYAATANSNLTIDGTPVQVGTNISYYSTGDSGISSNGTLFAVVLKRNGNTLSDIDTWYPVYGSDYSGYTVLETSGVDSVITAAKNGGATVFKKSASGRMMSASITNLPGDITRYYTYLLDECGGNYAAFLNTYDNTETTTNSEPQYVVAYYYTTETADENGNLNWNNVSNDNTVRVLSHSGVAEGVNNESFTVHWGTTIEVPNMENRLFFQKRNEVESTSADTGLIDKAVFALYPAIDAEQVSGGTGTGTHLEYYVGDGGGTDGVKKTVYVIPYTPATTGYDPDTPYTAAVFSDPKDETDGKSHLLGTGTYEFYTKDLSYDDSTGLVSSTSGTAGLMTVTLTKDASGNDVTTETKYYVHPATNAEGKPMVGYTHDSCKASSETGTGHFDKLTENTYLLREIAAPSGYALNDTNIPVLVNEIGVYANAGTDTDGVSVGNGIGYLSKTLDVFASPGQIDETLTWVYGALIRSTKTGFTAFDSVTHDVIHVQKDGGEATGWEFAVHQAGDLVAYGTDSSQERGDAMVIYYEYNGSLANDESKSSPIFDYIPNDDPDGGQTARTEGTQNGQTLADGTLLNRLWTKTGWSDMAIYQDNAYGSVHTISSTKYTDLTGYGNISNLFSSSTFVTVTDQPIITEAQVDVDVSKVASEYATDADNNKKTVPLSGAEFMLYKLDEDNTTKLYYKYTKEQTGEDGNITPASTTWVEKEGDGSPTILTSGEKGTLNDVFHNLPSGIYYLVETKAPDGYDLLTEPIQIDVTMAENAATGEITTTVMIKYGAYSTTYTGAVKSSTSESGEQTGNTGNNTVSFSTAARVETRSITDDEGNNTGFRGVYTYTLTIPNSTGYELPNAGGSGTTLYTLAGLLLILSGITCLLYRYKLRGKEGRS